MAISRKPKQAKTAEAPVVETALVLTPEVVTIPPPNPPKEAKGDAFRPEQIADAQGMDRAIKDDLAQGDRCFLKVARAFDAMNAGDKPSQRLYRALGFKTFEAYCESLNIALSTGHLYASIGGLLYSIDSGYPESELLTAGIASLRELARLYKANIGMPKIVALLDARIDGSLSYAELKKQVDAMLKKPETAPGTDGDGSGDGDEAPEAPQAEPWRADVQSLLDSAKSLTDFVASLRAFSKGHKTQASAA